MKSSTLLPSIEVPAASEGTVSPGSLYARLTSLTDTRKRRGRRYPLGLVVSLIVLAKLAGEKTPAGIAQWAQERHAWLVDALPVKLTRLPCANTYIGISRRIDEAELSALLSAYFAPALPELTATSPPPPAAAARRGQRHLALDGKQLCGSGRAGVQAVAPLQSLTLYDVPLQAALAQVAIPTKRDERSAARIVIANKDLQGCVLSADALHTHRDWAAQVRAQRGDYLLLVKANQPTLRAEIGELFAQPLPAWLESRQAMTVEKGHGRLEKRTLQASTELNDLLASAWRDVAQVFRLDRTVTEQGTTTTEVVYGLTSLPATVATPHDLLRLVRHHWTIENNLHWRRDVTLGEDDSRVRADTAAHVLAMLNTAVLTFMNCLGVTNVPAQMRHFMAHPAKALALLLSPPDF